MVAYLGVLFFLTQAGGWAVSDPFSQYLVFVATYSSICTKVTTIWEGGVAGKMRGSKYEKKNNINSEKEGDIKGIRFILESY